MEDCGIQKSLHAPFAVAAVTSLHAPDDAFGQVWNGTCAPTRTPRQILQLGADAISVPMRMAVVALWLLPVFGLFQRFMTEIADVKFTLDRPYFVDSTRFKNRFWSDVTPFEIAAAATAGSFLVKRL